MDPAEREAFKAQRREEDRERMAAAVAELASSEGWQRYIESRGRFHHYSMGNCLLIAMQYPEATQVAAYKTWQSLGRQVRKGETGIRISAPMSVKVGHVDRKRRDPVSSGHSAAQAAAAVRTSIYDKDRQADDRETRMLFKSVSVFDISQTDGEPLPELEHEPITGDSHADRLPMLERYADSLGFAVEYRDLAADERGGFCSYDRKLIVVDASQPANARVRILVHEIAHALGASSQKFGREDAEVMVESVTCIVLGSLGLDTSGESIPYVAGWGAGDADALKRHAKTVDEIASQLETALEVK